VCQDGKYIAAPCRGPKGCSVAGTTVSCDFSGNQDGDACPSAGEGEAACTADKQQMVLCRGGRYQLEACRGPKHCDATGAKVECDNSLQVEGDRCATEESAACSVDKQKTLMCKGGKFAVRQICRGPKKCDAQSGRVTCDRGHQEPGDPCPKPDDFECSVDDKALLTCKDGKWAVHTKCKSKCVSADDKAGCSPD
jgi:hypothetical protein